MTKHTASWDDYRPADGSKITVEFDWNDDHSSWRLEDLQEPIEEARTILESSGVKVSIVEHIYELSEYAEALRKLYGNDRVTDAVVRRGLVLADQLDISYDTQSMDASDQYDSMTDYVDELLEAWGNSKTWIITDDEYGIDPSAAFAKCRESRNGLGDRWKLEVTDEWVELPDGTTLYGYVPEADVQTMFDLICEHNWDEDTYPEIIKALTGLDKHYHPDLLATLEAFDEQNLEIHSKLLVGIIDFVKSANGEDMDRTLETFAVLASEWSEGYDDLLRTAASLTREALPA